MESERKVTFCRICEAACGLVATVEDGRITQLRPDREHPLSSGFACPKGIAMTELQYDPDRVRTPLRRNPSGELEPCSWAEAIDDIGTRLRHLRDDAGLGAVGWYMGNPGAFSVSHPLWVKGFLDAIGSRHYYTASSQDVSNRFAASALLYGSPVVVPIPDVERTSLLLMIGANPLVSHGSLLTAPRIRERLNAIVERGGRVVVADPRRTETARAYEHLPVRPDSDALLLLSLLDVLFSEDRVAPDARRIASGVDALEELASQFPPAATAEATGVPAARVRELARALSEADGAAVYGRTGSCLGRFGTLVAFLIDAVNVVTGNLDRPGGAVFGHAAISLDDVAHRVGLATYDRHRSRVGGLPEVLGALPASVMAEEMRTPGEGQLRALFVSAGNPVLSTPDGHALESALAGLELFVSIDLYVNDTAARHADYVLPATTFLERADMPLALMGFAVQPYIQWTEAVVEPEGEAREEWRIIDDIAGELGVTPLPGTGRRLPRSLAGRLTPERLIDLLLRTGPDGDWFGLRRDGLSLAKLRRRPSGVALRDSVPTGVRAKKVRHRGGRVRLDHPRIADEVARLRETGAGDPDFPLRLIGMRELRSHNSWMHNSPKLMTGDRVQRARVNPSDAAALGLADGDPVRIVSESGEAEVAARISDEVMPGVVALPHGWGHRGGWRVANAAGGVNSNVLASARPQDLEPLAGMAHLNGIPIRLEAVAAQVPQPGGGHAAADDQQRERRHVVAGLGD